MQVSVTGRHVDATDEMRTYAEEKASKLTRYYDRIERIEVIFDQESNKNRVEMVIRGDHKNTFVAQVDADTYFEGIDLVVDKLERQLTKHKEKLRNRKHPS